MTTISGLDSTASTLLANSSLATLKPSTPSSAANQSSGSTVGSSTAQSSGTNALSATPSANDIATAKAAAAKSSGYEFGTVAQNALIAMNANIQKTGITPSLSTTGAQWNQIFGDMDRRSLYAVASNQGGHFTTLEQQTASFTMDKQLGDVLNRQGLLGSMSNGSDVLNAYGKYITFLQNVSPEEKASPRWAVNMASAKTSYNDYASDLGQPQQTAAGTTPLVEVLMEAMKSAQYNPSRDKTVGEENDLAGIKSQPWAQGYESQIDAAYQATLLQAKGVNIQA